MLSPYQHDRLRTAFQRGTLQVQSVSPQGIPEWRQVQKVHRADVRPESIWEVCTEQGKVTVTGGHRIYVSPDPWEAVETERLKAGDFVLCVVESVACYLPLLSVTRVPARQYMYDLTVADNHNLVLASSCFCSKNSPDRNYHFRPPEHEADIGSYNRVFGYVWEDAELLEYLRRGVDWWDMFPPRTYVSTIDKLVAENPSWRTAIYYGGMQFALMALAINWVHDEFDYSIGGVSLSIEKSSKYESLKSNAEGQFDKATEAKARTVKFIRGLQQPRYGIGIRSAFGPAVGRGILSPRQFL